MAASVVTQWLDCGGIVSLGDLPGADFGSPLWRRLFPRSLQACRLNFWDGLSSNLEKRGRLRLLADRVLGSAESSTASESHVNENPVYVHALATLRKVLILVLQVVSLRVSHCLFVLLQFRLAFIFLRLILMLSFLLLFSLMFVTNQRVYGFQHE